MLTRINKMQVCLKGKKKATAISSRLLIMLWI